jgi:hypothetical protein
LAYAKRVDGSTRPIWKNSHALRIWSKISRAWVFARWWSSGTIGTNLLFVNSAPHLRLTHKISVWRGWLARKVSLLCSRTLLLSLVWIMQKWRLRNLWVTFPRCKSKRPMSSIQLGSIIMVLASI